MYFIYSGLLYLLLPLILLRLWWRGRLNPAYKSRIKERFGYLQSVIPAGPYIWVHAVSVGEVVAAVPLIHAIQAQWPDQSILFTTTTPTGSERVKALLGNSVYHIYFPYDFPDVINRFFNYVKPKILILLETEFWPNVLLACNKQKVPVFVANARLSEKSANGYGRCKFLLTKMLQSIILVAAQTAVDVERFAKIGIAAEKIHIAGNLKFAISLDKNLVPTAQKMREHWGKERFVWVAASTHVGEEEIILAVHQQLLTQIPNALLILVPRHPERFENVAKSCENLNLNFVRRSHDQLPNHNTQVFLADSMGELMQWYAASDVAFVGGSLVPIGGHNLLEPAALGLPILIGPYYFNFVEIKENLDRIGVLKSINSADALNQALLDLAKDSNKREHISAVAQDFMQARQHQSIEKHLELLKTILS